MVGRDSEGRVPVCIQDRLRVAKTSVAAALIAAVSTLAWAQTPDTQALDSQASISQAPALAPPELRGTEAPSLTDTVAETPTQPDDSNPVAAPPPLYGLPAPVSNSSDVINYGKQRPKKAKLYQVPRLRRYGTPPLPPLTSYKTAPDTTKRGSNPPLLSPTDPAPTVAVIPTLPVPPKPKPDPTPFDPLGVDVGSLRLFPYVEADTGYDSNPNLLSADIVPSPFVHGDTGLRVQSLWSQNSLTADLHGGYYDFFRVPDANRPDSSGTITGRVDVTRQTQINLQTTFSLQTEQPGSPLIAIPGNVFITNRPLIATFGQTAGFTQQFNRLSISLNAAFSRLVFGDATQSNGTDLLLSLDDYNDYGLVGRVSYELTPALIPFMQATVDARRYDNYFDVYGFARNSNGIAAEIGSTFEFTRLLTGELAAGYADRVYVDPRLPNLNAPTVDAKLIYTATPLTTVTFAVGTALAETVVPNVSGAVSRTASLELAHALRRDLTVTATATYENDLYEGAPISDQLYAGALRADYHVSRSVVITGSFTHQRFLSTYVGANYTENVFLLGLRLQL